MMKARAIVLVSVIVAALIVFASVLINKPL